MKTHSSPSDYKGFRFPPEIISHAVWLYFRFSLSFRDVEEFLAQRGIVVTYETVRQWCRKGMTLFVRIALTGQPPVALHFDTYAVLFLQPAR